ncbi:MAG: hypothetical protein U5L00_14580 [Desulfovermiculus sp.]|nr:hypothetical protein [Desulfovermiculus sp.]
MIKETTDQNKILPLVFSDQQENEHKEAQEARLGNNIDLMLEALEHETYLIGRHLLFRDIIAQCFPKRNQDPRMREIFLKTAQAHIQEMPRIIPELVDRFGSQPYFFTFSYYSIALTEAMEFDQALEVCRLALAYGAKDGLGVGFEQRIEQIAKHKERMLASQAA